MKLIKLTILACICLLLSSCSSITTRNQIWVIKDKSIPNGRQNKEYYYRINRPIVDIEFYSDSNWNVGDTIILNKIH